MDNTTVLITGIADAGKPDASGGGKQPRQD